MRYWGVGNENWGCGGNMTPEEYAGHYRRFATFLRDLGGVRAFRIACGPLSRPETTPAATREASNPLQKLFHISEATYSHISIDPLSSRCYRSHNSGRV